MDLSIAVLKDFQAIFYGHANTYGVHIEKKSEDKDVKKRGENYTKSEPVTEDLYVNHLAGVQGLGIVPIMSTGECAFGVLDVDKYGTDHAVLLRAIFSYDLPLVPFRSKSGGLHLYLFFSKPEPASKVIDILESFKILLSLDEKTEIFPKQRAIKDGQTGNWINLPYFNYEDTKQYLMDREGYKLSLEEAINTAKIKRASIDSIKKSLEALPMADGPPCIQSINLLGETSFRNNYLMSVATYYKAKVGDDFQFAVAEANQNLVDPLELDRLTATVIASHKKRSYTYLCKEEPICSICHKNVCKKRKYGIGGSEVSELTYESLEQIRTDPPYYIWTINGKKLKFYTEADLINQNMFRQLCLRYINILPMKLKEETWTDIVNKALKEMTFQDVEEKAEVSPGAMFKSYLVEFLTKRAPAQTKLQIMHGRVYKDTVSRTFVFKGNDLIAFLHGEKAFRTYGTTEIHERLKTMQAVAGPYRVDGDHVQHVWKLPIDSVERFIEETPEAPIDFMEEMPNEIY